jgi:ABC-type glycerol-3-phosphate transport system permease component
MAVRGLAAARVGPRPRGRTLLAAVQRALIYLVVVLGALLVLLPLYWLLRTSLMHEGDVMLYPPRWWPKPMMFSNYVQVLTHPSAPMLVFFRNSVAITLASLLGDLVSASLVAFALGRLRWIGRDVVFASVIAVMLLPGQVTMVPTFLLMKMLGWLNTFWPLIAPSWFGHAFFIFLLRQFIMTIPSELDDAARIDGCNALGVLWHVILPLTTPALATVAIFSFQSKWNQFMEPLIYINSKELLPVAVGLRYFRSLIGAGLIDTSWSHLMAASTLAVLPILITFFFAQRLFIQGIVVSGIKG